MLAGLLLSPSLLGGSLGVHGGERTGAITGAALGIIAYRIGAIAATTAPAATVASRGDGVARAGPDPPAYGADANSSSR